MHMELQTWLHASSEAVQCCASLSKLQAVVAMHRATLLICLA